jgi:hypothetical protein
VVTGDPIGPTPTLRIERSTRVAAAPELVYDVVADVTRIGEISPECVEADWTSGDPGEVGARFVGHNRVGDSTWSMECEVVVAERPNRFGWRVLTESVTPDTSVWTFRFAADGEGTLVTETFSMAEPPIGLQVSLDRHDAADGQQVLDWREARLTAGIEATLANLIAVTSTSEG